MAVWSCWILAGTGTRFRIRRSRASQTCSMGDIMSGEYAGQCVELGCFQLPGIVYRSLQHGAVHYHAATWGDGRGWMAQQWASGSRHGISVHAPVSITYACPYHNPTTTIHKVDISKPLTHTTPYMLSAICPVQWKPGFIREENTSPKFQTPSNVSIYPLKPVTTNCSQVETLMRTTSMQMSFPETVSDSLCRNSLVMLTDCCSSCPGGWSQTILEVKMLDVEVLSWCGYMWSAVVRPVGCTAKLSETLLERDMVEKWTFNSRATALVDIPAVSMPIARSLKTCNICGIVLCDKTAHCGTPVQ